MDLNLINCRLVKVTYLELVEYMSKIDLGPLKNIKITNCPVPEESFHTFITDTLGATGVEIFTFESSRGNLKPFHFTNLTGIIHLDLRRSLRNVTLDKTWFQDIQNLTRLTLDNNPFIRILPGTFLNVAGLEALDMAGCELSSLQEDVFSGLSNLRSLNLHSNKLTDLPPSLFKDLGNLKVFNFHNNRLTGLPSGIFDPLVSLETIHMGQNRYETLPDNLFLKTMKLRIVRFVINNQVCKGGAVNCANMIERMTLPPSLFQIPSLEVLYMLHVPINNFPVKVFKGATKMVNLTLQSMYVDDVPPGLFEGMGQLQKLDLSGNLITNLTDGTFDGLRKLKVLRFRKNLITSISRWTFKDLVKLETLHLHENLIATVHNKALASMTDLAELDLSANNLVYDGKDRTRNMFLSSQPFERLVTLDLSENSFSALEYSVVINHLNLKTLNLSRNSFKVFNLENFNFVKNGGAVDVDLSYNQIERVDISVTKHINLLFANKTNLFILNLTGNPLICDCFITELKEKVDGVLNTSVKKFFALSSNDLRCGSDLNPSLKEIDYDDLNCDFPSDLLKVDCPDPCGCSWNKANDQITVDCKEKELTKFPKFIPTIQNSTVALHLENNKISDLHTAVQHFYLPNSSRYSSIRELYLSNNSISTFDHTLLPPSLAVLNLDYNFIKHFSKQDLNYFDQLINRTRLTLRLRNNSFECSCESKDLFHFLQRRSEVLDKDHVFPMCSGIQTKPLYHLGKQ